jgi:hypothetical protein
VGWQGERQHRERRKKMAKKNEFCVNDKKRGSCWGEVKTWEDIKKMTDNTNIQKIETKMMGVLDDWNGKKYAWIRNDNINQNYFIEI